MTEIAVRHSAPTTLSVTDDQTYWTEGQVKALQHIGVDKATPADLAVFFHHSKRTGLDPFARQIYMIGRWTKDGVKQTIQVGIDGFRLIGRRSADAAGHAITVKAPEWLHPEWGWKDAWIPGWGYPAAARVTIVRDGGEFTATAIFDEYKQTTKNGDLTSMWKQRPAGQIAKCAEAAAWRMAFPQDLSGLYAPEETEHLDVQPNVRRSAFARAAAPEPEPIEAEVLFEEVSDGSGA